MALDGGADGLDVQRRVAAAAPRWLAPGGHLLIETSERQAPLTAAAVAAAGLVPRVERSDELDATAVVGVRTMIDDPSRSTVVAWYETLPEDLALLVERVQVGAGRLLGDTFTPRDPAQVHATLIGLESAPAPFDPAPLAAHLREALSPPWTIRFGGFAPGDRRLLSRGLPLHERMVGVYGSKVVLIGWPVVDGEPQRILAELRLRCAEFGVTHRYGDDPDVYLVLGEVAGASDRTRRWR